MKKELLRRSETDTKGHGNAGIRYNSKKYSISLGLSFMFLLLLCHYSVADRLPSEVSENQQLSIDSVIDGSGSFEDETRMNWIITKNSTTTDTTPGKGGIIASAVYDDVMLSNGGNISENRNFGFDSSSMSKKTFNIDSEKILTYTGTDGSILSGGEYAILDMQGNYSSDKTNETACVLRSEDISVYPAFSNIVNVRSDLLNMNRAIISTKSQIRAAGSSSTPSGIGYRIAVSPDAVSGDQYADGTVRTEFTGSITEARVGKKSSSSKSTSSSSPDWKTPATTNEWKDITEVTGGIEMLQKSFEYTSGMKV